MWLSALFCLPDFHLAMPKPLENLPNSTNGQSFGRSGKHFPVIAFEAPDVVHEGTQVLGWTAARPLLCARRISG